MLIKAGMSETFKRIKSNLEGQQNGENYFCLIEDFANECEVFITRGFELHDVITCQRLKKFFKKNKIKSWQEKVYFVQEMGFFWEYGDFVVLCFNSIVNSKKWGKIYKEWQKGKDVATKNLSLCFEF